MMRPVYSPSKLSLLITRTSRLRHQYMAGIMQLCQKEYTHGRSARLFGEPSAHEMLKRMVGPRMRMAKYPAQVINHSWMRSFRVNLRQGLSVLGKAGVAMLTASFYRAIG